MALIDVDVAIRAAVEYIEDWNHVQSMYHRRMLAEKFMALPTVDAVPAKHGRWIYHIDDLFPAESTQECDQCHEEQPLTCDDNFCPNCGARMDGKQNG